MSLRLDWCSQEAARYAVLSWHYSRRMPSSKLARIGVWENGRFVGAVVFGVGATPNIARPYGLEATQVCELVRVALRKHETPVSRVLRIAVQMMKRQYSRLRLIVSFADTGQGHHGGIYQAAGWIYTGSEAYHAFRVLGEIVHPRTLHDRYGRGGQSIPWLRQNVDRKAERLKTAAKHKYVLPLDPEIRDRVLLLSKPYPKRGGSDTGDTPAHPAGEGGSTPTLPLHSTEAA
jgi:hypothetical protein